ncbi:PREDICTED: uncharacterized protein LOC108695185 [Atta colombica]|uniref:uncharacterized protein LOC108695185 n=1 Tax=Atta colombica TaxID=520822 RepID=UPI00084C1E99|nr:PREDICTED: uncharacterized protein LOC108695185 [Atta colombica]
MPLSLTLKEGTVILEESDTEEDRNEEDKVINDEEDMDKGKRNNEKEELLDGTEVENKIQQNIGQLFKLEKKEVNINKEESEEEGLKAEEIGRALYKMKKKKAARIDSAYESLDICRLEKEMETKDMIPESQTRFKRRRSTTNNIFILMYDTEGKKSGRKKKKKYDVMDLKVLFDKMNRNRLWEILRGKSINEYLVRNIEKMYEEMEMRIKLEARIHTIIQNNERNNELEKRRIGGIRLGKDRIWSYVND